jgi:ATP-dependent helicase/nuclease subunit A
MIVEHQIPPRVIIRASAGSGKTTRLALHVIDLLLRGERPSSVLATTFTRKAAGEIVSRIFLRLAEACTSDSAREALRSQLAYSHLSLSSCSRALSLLISEQHLLRISTIDAWVLTLARSFSIELGILSSIRPCGDSQRNALFLEACAQVVSSLVTEDALTVLDGLERDSPRRSVLARLSAIFFPLQGVTTLLSDEDWQLLEINNDDDNEITPEQIANALEEIVLPKNKDGTSHKGWTAATTQLQNGLFKKEWHFLLSKGWTQALIEGEDTYYNHPIPDLCRVLLQDIVRCGRVDLLPALQRQQLTFQKLSKSINKAFNECQFAAGVVTYDTLKTTLALSLTSELASEISFRLGTTISHLLLDEFQDTSHLDWGVFNQLVDDILTDSSTSKTFLCVGDEKQSIYGFRGGTSELFDMLESRYESLSHKSLADCYRCRPNILTFLNTTFTSLVDSLPAYDNFHESLSQFQSRFIPHRSCYSEGGFVEFCSDHTPERILDENDEALDDNDLLHYRHIADKVREFHSLAPSASIGILFRSNAPASRCAQILASPPYGLIASVETVFTLGNDITIATVLSLLQFSDHPGDTDSLLFASLSPLSVLLSTSPVDSIPLRECHASRIRREISEGGLTRFLTRAMSLLVSYGAPYTSAYLTHLLSAAEEYHLNPSVRLSEWIGTTRAIRVERTSSSPIKIFTLHGAKGLEFDLVILPFLHKMKLFEEKHGLPLIVHKKTPTLHQTHDRPPLSVAPNVPKGLHHYFPEIAALKDAKKCSNIIDELCLLYVGMTRARAGLSLLSGYSRAKAPTCGSLLSHVWTVMQSGTPEQRQAVCPNQKTETLVSFSAQPRHDPSTPLGATIYQSKRSQSSPVRNYHPLINLDDYLIDTVATLLQRRMFHKRLSIVLSLTKEYEQQQRPLDNEFVASLSEYCDPKTTSFIETFVSSAAPFLLSSSKFFTTEYQGSTYQGNLTIVGALLNEDKVFVIDFILSSDSKIPFRALRRKEIIDDFITNHYKVAPNNVYSLGRLLL